jgi:hypothetical protein
MRSPDAAFAAATLLLALAACDRGRPPRGFDVHDTPPPPPAAALLATAGAMENKAIDSLPPSPGKDVLLRACTTCHAASLITQQRKTPQEWAKTVDKMVGWGAPLAAEDKQRLIDYLGTTSGPSK